MSPRRYAASPSAMLLDSRRLSPGQEIRALCLACDGALELSSEGFTHQDVGTSCSRADYLTNLCRVNFFSTYSHRFEMGQGFYIVQRSTRWCTRFEALIGKRHVISESVCFLDLTERFDTIAFDEEGVGVVLSSMARPDAKVHIDFVAPRLFPVSVKRNTPCLQIPIEGEQVVSLIESGALDDTWSRWVSGDARALSFLAAPTREAGDGCDCASRRFFSMAISEGGKTQMLEHVNNPELEPTLAELETFCRDHVDSLEGLFLDDIPATLSSSSKLIQDERRRLTHYKLMGRAGRYGALVRDCFCCAHFKEATTWSRARKKREQNPYCHFHQRIVSPDDATNCDAYRESRSAACNRVKRAQK